MAGRELGDIAAEWQLSGKEAAERLLPGGAIYFQLDEDDVRARECWVTTRVRKVCSPSRRRCGG